MRTPRLRIKGRGVGAPWPPQPSSRAGDGRRRPRSWSSQLDGPSVFQRAVEPVSLTDPGRVCEQPRDGFVKARASSAVASGLVATTDIACRAVHLIVRYVMLDQLWHLQTHWDAGSTGPPHSWHTMALPRVAPLDRGLGMALRTAVRRAAIHPAGRSPEERTAPLEVRHIGIALALFEPAPEFLHQPLASITAQSWTAWTCIITADSPLADLCTDPQLAPFVADPRFHWYENPERLGHRRNFERAIQKCAAQPVEAIACCDQDDIWEADKLAVLADVLAQAGALALVHSDLCVVAADGTTVLAPSAWQAERRGIAQVSPEHLLVRNVVSGCTMLFDVALARRVPTIPTVVRYHDKWYALLAACLGGVYGVPRVLVRYRQHGAQVMGVHHGPLSRGVLRALPHLVRGLVVRGHVGALAATRRRPTHTSTAGARRVADEWRRYVALSDAVYQLGLLPTRRLGGMHSLLMGVRWLHRDPMLGVASCKLAVGSVLARVLRSEPVRRDSTEAAW
jgi:hypothetical protein